MSKEPKTTYLKDYRPPAYAIHTCALEVDLFDDHTNVCAKMQMERVSEQVEPLELMGEKLELVSVAVNGKVLSADQYTLTAETLVISEVPAKFDLEIKNVIHPETNTALTGLYRSGSMFCTQCEAQGFRRITYYLDRPDVMAKFTTVISADKEKYPILLSNGNRVDSGDCKTPGRHWVSWNDPFKKPSYLFALVAGDLSCVEDSFTTMSKREIKLQMFVEHGNESKCQHALDSLKKSMRWDEEAFGREYDLDLFMIVAVSDFNMGAMENKGLNIFNTKYALVCPDISTDQDFFNVESVIAHEYFHNWTGNRITCRDWFQLSLKEGLTIYRDQEFSQDMHSRALVRIKQVRALRASQYPEDAGPMAHPVRPQSYIEVNNFYTATVYNKGAEVIRMMRTLVSKEGFRRATDAYFNTFDGQAVTIDDLIDCVENTNKMDLTKFRNWYQFAGTPELEISTEYDDQAYSYKITITQDCPDTPGQTKKPPFVIPLRVGLVDERGEDIPLHLEHDRTPLHGNVLVLKERQETFKFVHVVGKPVPSFSREFSAPVKVHYDYSDEELAFLLAHDNDHFNRFESGQQLMKRVLVTLVNRQQQVEPLECPEVLTQAFEKILASTDLDKDLLAQCLSLPAETEINDLLEVVDVDAIHKARQFLLRHLADGLYSQWQSLFHENKSTNEAFSLEHHATAKRALANLCLGYMVARHHADDYQTCYQYFASANNMTDKTAAFMALVNCECEQREQAIAEFYQQWSHEPLVIDKWFAAQAASILPNTLDNVKALMKHDAFNMKNPNRAMSLISVFGNNQIRFHDATGAGYEFMTDNIIQFNGFNPQVAAYFVRPLLRWRRFDETRRDLMKTQLERILKVDALSPNVYELVTKALD